MSNLPPLPPDGSGLDDLRAAVRALILWANSREPQADGGTLEKFITAGEAVEQGLLTYSTGGGVTGDLSLPPPSASDPYDSSAPTAISGLSVAGGVSHYLITWDAPSYPQGGGNGRTVIYAANYSGTGPLPAFGDAVEIGAAPGKAVILVVAGEPGAIKRFWAKAETRFPTLQASPTGGLNGVGATAELIEDQHILNLTAAKLIAGSIGVSEYIQSTGWTGSGVSEWRIDGNGVARFTGVVVSGTVTATAGSFANVTIAGALTMNTSGHIKGGQTAFNTGTGFFLGYDSTAYKFSIGNATLGMTWDGSNLTINGGGIFSGNVTGSVGGVGVAAVLADIAGRLRRDTNEILGAILTADTVASPAGFRAGSISWDAAGDVTSGSGVAITPKGLVGHNGTTATFTINATTGAATFAGALSAVTGSFGDVTVGGALTTSTSGHLKGGQTDYNTGTGFFLGYSSGAYKFSIGNATLGLTWDGTNLTLNGGGVFSGNVTGSLGGTAAATVLSDIAARLRRDTNEILGAVLSVNTVASPAGFRAGTLTWDASGAYVSGSGVAMTPLGLVGYNGSTPTFSINASTGAATFAGALSAVTGSFGAVTIGGALTMNTSGHVKAGQTAYDTGTGFFLGYDGAAYKFSIGSSTQSLTWDGSALVIKGTLTVGSSPAVSGTTMTGTGAVFNTGGTFAAGNATKNISFNGTTLTINGDLVATGNIVANAATEITELSVSSLSVTGASGTGTNYLATSSWTFVGTVSFTAALTGNVLLSISVGASFSGAPGIGSGELWCALTLNADFDDDDTVDAGETLIEDFVIVPQTGTGPVRTAYVSVNIPRAVTSGVAYTWNIYAQKLEGTCTISNFYARVEQIKR